MKFVADSTGAHRLMRRYHLLVFVAAVFVTANLHAQVLFQVSLGEASATPVSGRLLVFAKRLGPDDNRPVTAVDRHQIDTRAAAIAAREVAHLEPGATVTLDADITAYPSPFSQLPHGRYAVQAVLDRDHSYNYSGRGADDLVSGVVEMNLPGNTAAVLSLTTAIPQTEPVQLLSNSHAATRGHIHAVEFTSPSLSRFWGRPVTLRGWVVTPPDYAAYPRQRYPTVYYTQGFGGSLRSLYDVAAARWSEMKAGEAPPMIWVGVDQSSPTGTSEFVDSVNNGPWGHALVAELIPHLERQYRMDGRPSGRLLTGHSSGGWAALWLQIGYPKMFGGAWPTAPDPVDFHDFVGIDLYSHGANVYRKPDGTPYPLAHDKGKMLVALEDYARREAVLGEYGGQLASFEWAFSPRAADGRPMPMFDRTTGAVDAAVIAYWKEHYDIAERLRRRWPESRQDLDGKIHLTVGSADSFYLDRAARLLEATMKALGAKTDFRYIEGRSHFDLYGIGADRWGLYKTIAWEMYASARPRSKRPPRPVR